MKGQPLSIYVVWMAWWHSGCQQYLLQDHPQLNVGEEIYKCWWCTCALALDDFCFIFTIGCCLAQWDHSFAMRAHLPKSLSFRKERTIGIAKPGSSAIIHNLQRESIQAAFSVILCVSKTFTTLWPHFDLSVQVYKVVKNNYRKYLDSQTILYAKAPGRPPAKER